MSLVLLFLFVETISYFYSVYNFNLKDARNIFAHQLAGLVPLSSKVLWSILSSTIIEVLKKRWILLEMICPKEQNPNISEMEGMPPAYIVVDMRWDDEEDDVDDVGRDNKLNIDEKIEEIKDNNNYPNESKIADCIQNYWKTNTSLFDHRYSFWPDNIWHCKIGNPILFLDQICKHQMNEESFCIANVRGFNFPHCEVLKLSMRLKEAHLLPQKMAVIQGLLPYLPLETCRPFGGGLYMCGENTQELLGSSLAEHNAALTENMKGIWYILAGKFNLFLANSAVGVVISLAFINANDIIHESKDHDSKTKGMNWRKVKRKEKLISTRKTNNCYNFSPCNEEEPASYPATTLTPAY
eukprot:GFUD01002156.1.p1 GENE.GFUD01002156.1~~GFUD01002156.1.p1  ORF type:complete len:354 (+),score=44.63 GFUD01002156.1:300-1361(+)